ncbi:MAG: hypothetical protein AUK63_280 [bacterium P3]|nr:MAG: hypothetical protein AUK63_280 [bacterium P3]KWW42759.1 MAG: hypothetical protein F083_163 [bacterium F083]
MFEETERYKTLSFYARQIVEGYITGLHRSPSHGFSVEFAEHRQYNNGESTRNIDWRLYGRTDRLFVKQFAEETNLRCRLVVDHSGSMRFPTEGQGNTARPNKLTFALYACAILLELLVRQRDAFGLTLLSDGMDVHSEMRSSKVHQRYLLELLERELREPATEGRRTAVAASLHRLAEEMHRRSMVVLFTDALTDDNERETLFDALRHLRHNKHEVLLFHTLDYGREARFEFDDRPTLFIDLESGRRLKAQPAEVESRYRETMRQQLEEIRRHAMQYRIDYQPVAVEEGVERVMLPFLLKRARMR